MEPVRVLIADDQPLVREGLRATLAQADGLRIVGEACDGLDAVRLAQATRPGVVLMDIRMPGLDGLEATERLCGPDGVPGVRIIMLTMFDQDEHVFGALRAGASGFLLKDVPGEKIVEAVRVVAAGDALLAPAVTRRLIAEFARRPTVTPASAAALDGLTARETDVWKLLVRGYGNEEIARLLSLGESTVKSHVQHLYQKLGVRDRVQLVIHAYECGLLRPGVAMTSAERMS
ncbi:MULTISPECIES: response regulator transcription factor [Actinomadura]|uniref:Response regulator transcription factor n=1 Tax=Actinomadura miaoliensis TaxID=430685 RepID=A0ABP7V2A9_9ACTN